MPATLISADATSRSPDRVCDDRAHVAERAARRPVRRPVPRQAGRDLAPTGSRVDFDIGGRERHEPLAEPLVRQSQRDVGA